MGTLEVNLPFNHILLNLILILVGISLSYRNNVSNSGSLGVLEEKNGRAKNIPKPIYLINNCILVIIYIKLTEVE